MSDNWRAQQSLPDFMCEHGIVGIEGIDTRALTRRLRDRGAQEGIISTVENWTPLRLGCKGPPCSVDERPGPCDGRHLRCLLRLD